MNHGLKVNGNVLEITLPDGIDIEKVVVNGKSFHETKRETKQQATVSSDCISRKDAIANVASEIWHYPNELYTTLNCFENCQELAERALNRLPPAELELDPCSFCKHNDDCGYMSAYCPAERKEE